MKKSILRYMTWILLTMMIGYSTVFAADYSETKSSSTAPAARIPKPGIPANPAISPDAWSKSKYVDFYTNPKNWDASGLMGFVEYDPSLPRILLVGDSISMGYTQDVRQMLKGKANVYRISGNGGDATRFLANYEKYLGAGTNWDLIHFNWGLHDLTRQDPSSKKYDSSFPPRYTEQEYAQNIEKCLAILESTGAHLVWASTTPVPLNSSGRVTGDEVVRNKVAADIMQKHGIAINDLYTLMTNEPDYHASPGNVHFTGEGSYVMAKQIVKVIGDKLGIQPNKVSEVSKARLVNQWRFDNNYDDEITKTKGVAAGTDSFAFEPGRLSPCLHSKASGKPKTLTLGAEAGGLQNLSVTLWFKAESLNQGTETLIKKTGDAKENVGWEISLRKLKEQTDVSGATTQYGIWFRIGNSSLKMFNLRYDRPAFTAGDGKWYHLAVTFDGETRTAKIYVDGILLTRASGISESPLDLVSQLTISDDRYGFKGWLDELQIWDGVLSDSQIKELVNQEGG
jgi:acyl-CoA thioesterase-1